LGRSDTRENLRRFFEIDKESVVISALDGLAKAGKIPSSVPREAIEKFGATVDKFDITMDGIY